jgi:hypothetical protein
MKSIVLWTNDTTIKVSSKIHTILVHNNNYFLSSYSYMNGSLFLFSPIYISTPRPLAQLTTISETNLGAPCTCT